MVSGYEVNAKYQFYFYTLRKNWEVEFKAKPITLVSKS